MKIKLKMLAPAITLFIMLLCSQFSFASGGVGSIMGRVTDSVTKTGIGDVTVVAECNGIQRSFITNDSGYYYASNLPVGLYNVVAGYMSNRVMISGIKLNDDQVVKVDIDLNAGVNVLGDTGIVVRPYYPPVVDMMEPTTKTTGREDFKHEPVTKIGDITETQPGVTEVGGNFYIHGAREGGLVYYIDGGPVMATADIPLCGLETYTIYSDFIPAKYGDTVGGVIVLETRNFFAESH